MLRILGSLAVVLSLSAGIAQATVVIDTVTVGNPGNEADTTGYGSVAYTYNIGKYEVTAGQYCEFLNAKAATADPYGLYNPNMGSVVNAYGCNITRTNGPGGAYIYSVPTDWANRPVNYVGFWDACRFVNWLHNGQGAGDTETGAYSLNGYAGSDGQTIVKNAEAKWWIPSLDEWHKAAYHKNDGSTGNYWDYPTGTDTTPDHALLTPDGGNNANFQQSDFTIGAPYYRTEVGAFAHSASPYGTFDQGGNVWEWNDSLMMQRTDYAERGLRGGSFWFGSFGMFAANQNGREPAIREDAGIGFRVASASVVIPEPSTVVTLLLGMVGLFAWKRMKATA